MKRLARGALAALALAPLACGDAASDDAGAPPVVVQGTAGSGGAPSSGGGASGSAGSVASAGKSASGGVSSGGASGFPGTSGASGKATGGTSTGGTSSGGTSSGGTSGASGANAGTTGAAGSGGAPPAPCKTRITYGDFWIHPDNHPDDFDDVDGDVTWDGACVDEGANSSATLSNGWKPIFSGNGACVLAIDRSPSCPDVPATCTTRVSYGPAWLPPPNHPNAWDDVQGRVFWDRGCIDQGGNSYGTLSNGWAPHFSGSGACRLSFEYEQCGGLYRNPVIGNDCPDPGVLLDGDHYVMTCTGGGSGGAYRIFTSPDLVHWTKVGDIFPAGAVPAWSDGSYWAPEIHRVGNHYVAYFTAHQAGGPLVIGAATSDVATGPFTDVGAPLVTDPNSGVIDASEFEDENGNPYVIWKVDGNAFNPPHPTVIRGAPLSPDGTSVVGSAVDLFVNDPSSWEGIIVEGPWIVRRGGTYFLFYSGNWYNQSAYSVGVASSNQPLAQYARIGSGPILASDAGWSGPGHCSVVDTPAGDTYMVYHAWHGGKAGQPGEGRYPLVDAVFWDASGNPYVPAAPSVHSRPMP